jgi:hypothetical protein
MKMTWAVTMLATLALPACDDSPTTAVVENTYAPASVMTVYKTWWVTTLFASPVAAGATSETERTIPGRDFAYALLAPGWSPEAGGTPSRLVAVKSVAKLAVSEHQLLRIAISGATFVGDCATGPSLTVDDARLVVGDIFPGDFAGLTYDATTCTSSPALANDGGHGDGGADADAISD